MNPQTRSRSRPTVRRRHPIRNRTVLLLSWATRLLPVATLLAGVVATVLVATTTAAFAADSGGAAALAAESLDAVINNLRTWLLAILAAVATLFLTIGGLRYLAANGDTGELEKAKSTLKSAALGYALALLAPLFVTIVGEWVR